MKIFINCIKINCHGRFKNEKACNSGRQRFQIGFGVLGLMVRLPLSCSEFCESQVGNDEVANGIWKFVINQCSLLIGFLHTGSSEVRAFYYQSWARYLVYSCLALGMLNIPIGTLKGGLRVYGYFTG